MPHLYTAKIQLLLSSSSAELSIRKQYNIKINIWHIFCTYSKVNKWFLNWYLHKYCKIYAHFFKKWPCQPQLASWTWTFLFYWSHVFLRGEALWWTIMMIIINDISVCAVCQASGSNNFLFSAMTMCLWCQHLLQANWLGTWELGSSETGRLTLVTLSKKTALSKTNIWKHMEAYKSIICLLVSDIAGKYFHVNKLSQVDFYFFTC